MKLFTVKFTFCSELEKVLLTDLYKQVALKAEFSNSPVMTSESNNQRNPIQKKYCNRNRIQENCHLNKNSSQKYQYEITTHNTPKLPALFHR